METSNRDVNMLGQPPQEKLSFGQKMADMITSAMGSWPFIIGQAALLAGWIILNTVTFGAIVPWDPTLILLNLALSCNAAFAGAFILMSQNRRSQKDRQLAQSDYALDLEAAESLRELHRKVDVMMKAMPKDAFKTAAEPAHAAAAPAPAEVTNDNRTQAKAAEKPAQKR